MGANAQTSVPVFTAGQILTAQQQTEINTGIPVFATTTTRDAAFGGTGEKTLAEGQFAYIEATNTTQYYDGAAWQTLVSVTPRIGQVLSVTKTSTFTTTSTTYTDLTDLTLTITPTATSSKILVMYAVQALGISGTNMGSIQIVRGSTAIGNADAAGSRSVSSTIVVELTAAQVGTQTNSYLDSPATTSATTYKLQIKSNIAGTIYVNRTATDTDNVAFGRGTSSLTIFEVLV